MTSATSVCLTPGKTFVRTAFAVILRTLDCKCCHGAQRRGSASTNRPNFRNFGKTEIRFLVRYLSMRIY